ncbi:MAG TPA: caspase family protein [Thermoanaerobaculia bacterium]|nr:caspase family protein [Thermoanaerobaculia bacterium]
MPISVERRAVPLFAAALVAASLVGKVNPAAAQESAGCRQARQIVAEVARLYAADAPNHAALLNRLATARDLCPSLGEAWKYSACAARALGQEAKARVYADRAVLNGVADLDCGADSGTAAPRPLADLGPIRDKHALVVGIGTFADPDVKQLFYTAKDAKDFYAYLVDQQGGRFDPKNVVMLIDKQATRSAILKAVQRIFERAHEEDLLVVYISTHGSPSEDDKGLQGVGYIITYDTEYANLYVDALEFQDFSEKIALIKARRKVTFLDTCYSGQALQRGAKSLSIQPLNVSAATAKLFTSVEGSYLITSSNSSEQSWESDRLRNSFFTYYLLDALRQGEEPRTLKEVFADLSRKVAAKVQEEKRAPQNPQLHPSTAPADVRIGAPPVARSESPPTEPN